MPERKITSKRGVSSSRGAGNSSAINTQTTKAVSEKDSTLGYEISITKKIGDFEFIKLTASLNVPATISDKELSSLSGKLVVVRDKLVDRLEQDFQTMNL